MSLVVARQAAAQAARDPMVQQLVLHGLEEAGEGLLNLFKKKKRNRKKRNQQSKLNVIYDAPVTRAPVAVNARARTRRARVRGNTKGGITIKHREYIGEVNGNTSFSASSYQVQPGLNVSFPWLSGIANNFEKYRVKSLVLEYINVSATSERGRVTMAFDADPLDEDPAGKVDLFSYKGAVEGSVWSPLRLVIPCENKDYFTRDGTISGTDLKTYDMGKLIVGASNTADTSVIGELFLSYEIELTIPQPTTCPSVRINSGGTVDKNNPFGDAPVVQAGNMPITVLNNTITFDAPGHYLVMVKATGTAPSTVSSGGTATRGDTDSCTDNPNGLTESTVEIWAKTPGETWTASYSGTAVTSTIIIVSKCSPMTV